MKKIILILFLLPWLVVFGLPVRTDSDAMLHPDSIQRIFLQEPDRALYLLDIAEQRRLPQLQPFMIDILRSMCYQVKDEQTLKEHYARRALEQDSVRLVPVRKLKMMAWLVGTLDVQGKYEEGIRLCRETIDLARELENVGVEGEMLCSMGRFYEGMNQTEKALESFRQGIDLMKDTEDVRVMWRLSMTYGEMTGVLIKHEYLEEAVNTGHIREKLIARMSTLPGPTPKYIDQEYGYVYSRLSCALQKLGRTDEAEMYYHRFLTTQYSKDDPREIIPYLLAAGRFREALGQNNQAFAAFAATHDRDTVNHTYLLLLERYAEIWQGMGNLKEQAGYLQRIRVLQDSIYTREQRSRAQEYATSFRLNEKELQLAEARTVAQRRNFLLVGSVVVMILLITLLVIIWHNLRTTRQRNRIAAKQINELMAQREELRKVSVATPIPDKPENGVVSEENDTTVEYALFLRMERKLMDERLFLQPGFGRDDLWRISGVGKNDFSAFLQRHTDGANANDYLNRLRVEYALCLMKEKRNLSIEAIGCEAGFNSKTTFYRAFYKVFGMTPAQYLKATE